MRISTFHDTALPPSETSTGNESHRAAPVAAKPPSCLVNTTQLLSSISGRAKPYWSSILSNGQG